MPDVTQYAQHRELPWCLKPDSVAILVMLTMHGYDTNRTKCHESLGSDYTRHA